MKLFTILLTLISFNALADKALIQGCSNSPISKKDIATLKAFASNSDHISVTGKCIDIVTKKNKTELFNRVLNMKFPGIRITSSASVDTKKCELTLERVENENRTNNNYGANAKNKYAEFRDIKTSASSKTSSKLVIANGKSASYIYDNFNIDIYCSVSGKGYNLDFKIKGPSIALKNSTFLAKSGKVEIGNIIKNADRDTSKIDIGATSGKFKFKQNKNVKVYLIAN